MREKKFRAWDGNEMHKNVSIIHGEAIKHGYHGTAFSDTAKAGIPMQYTGLKDSTGKEIYEGDIIIDSDGMRAQIKWDEGRLAWIANAHVDWSPLARFYVPHIEIIGNKYENPELMEV